MKLKQYIAENTTVTAFAAKIGRSRMQVHRYLNGENITLDAIEEIYQATDKMVAPSDWFDVEQQEPAQ